MDQDFFDRLPPDVKEATQAKQRQQEAQAEAYSARLGERRKRSTILGAIMALFFGCMGGGPNPVFLIMITVAGTAAGLMCARMGGGHLSGMFIYGGATIATMIVSFMAGLIDSSPFSFLCSWVFLVGAGAFIGSMVEQHRTKHDTF